MRFGNILRFSSLLSYAFAALVLAVFIIAPLQAQQQEEKQARPKIKDFGQSIKKKKDKSDSKPDKSGKSGKSNKSDNNDKNEAATPNQPVNPNQSTDIVDEEVITVDTSLVRTDVLVVNQKGNAILGLKAEDFIVTENDVQQEIGTFSLGDSAEVPRSVVLIIDYSGSQRPYIQTSVEAAKVLVDKLNPRDQMAIVTDDVKLLTQFTGDKELLKKKLDGLLNDVKNGEIGESKQYSSLMATLNELITPLDVRPIIIFQTDGDQLFGIRNADGSANQSEKDDDLTTFTDTELISTVEKSRATIYSVISGFSLLGLTPEARLEKTAASMESRFAGLRENSPNYIIRESDRLFRQQSAMAVIAKISGGFTNSLENPEQANAIYSSIFAGIERRYLIGYYPTNQDRDGKRRSVKIEVRGHPEYIVLGRKFYYAPNK